MARLTDRRSPGQGSETTQSQLQRALLSPGRGLPATANRRVSKWGVGRSAMLHLTPMSHGPRIHGRSLKRILASHDEGDRWDATQSVTIRAAAG